MPSLHFGFWISGSAPILGRGAVILVKSKKQMAQRALADREKHDKRHKGRISLFRRARGTATRSPESAARCMCITRQWANTQENIEHIPDMKSRHCQSQVRYLLSAMSVEAKSGTCCPQSPSKPAFFSKATVCQEWYSPGFTGGLHVDGVAPKVFFVGLEFAAARLPVSSTSIFQKDKDKGVS